MSTYGAQRVLCAHSDKCHLVNCASANSQTSNSPRSQDTQPYEERVYQEIPPCTRLSAIYTADHCQFTAVNLSASMKSAAENSAHTLMLPQHHGSLTYNNGSLPPNPRRFPPAPERRKAISLPESSYKFRVFNENTAIGFFIAFVLTFVLLAAQLYFRNTFLTLYSRNQVVDLSRNDAVLEMDVAKPLIAPARKVSYMTLFVDTKSNLGLFFNTTASAKFVIYAMRTLSPTPTTYDYRRVVRVDTLHSQGSLRPEPSFEDVLRDSLGRNGLISFPVDVGQWNLAILNDDTQPLHLTVTPYTFFENDQNQCHFDCFGKGSCSNGTCHCFPGYSGKYCQETSCPILCNGNGVFLNGECVCHFGFAGKTCDRILADRDSVRAPPVQDFIPTEEYPQKAAIAISSELSAPKSFEPVESQPQLDQVLSKPESNDVKCQNGGRYVDGQCNCRLLFGGQHCEANVCLNDCNGNGDCLDGKCRCRSGFNGEDCAEEACPNLCNGHGKCEKLDGNYGCICEGNYFGEACNFRIERECNDGLDNDQDGLQDCLDPDCCKSPHCQANPLCMATHSNVSELIARAPPPPAGGFFDRFRPLIQADANQRYADEKSFERRLFSVVRVRVVDERAGPLMGMRVGNELRPKQGFTLTARDGTAHLALNGGAYVRLSLLRNPLGALSLAAYLPPNELLHLGQLSVGQLRAAQKPAHFRARPSPVCQQAVLDVNGLKVTAHPRRVHMMTYRKVVDQGNGVELVYRESPTNVYFEFGNDLDRIVEYIRLEMSVAGRSFIYKIKPRPGFVFEFDGKDGYGKDVHGKVWVNAKIGYKFVGCDSIYWRFARTPVVITRPGPDCCGPFNLNIYHRYDPTHNVLMLGNGTNVDFDNIYSVKQVQSTVTPETRSDSVVVLPDDSVLLKKSNGIFLNGKQVLSGFNFDRADLVFDRLKWDVYVMWKDDGKILKLRSIVKYDDPSKNFKVIVESSQKCQTALIECLNGTKIKSAKFSQLQAIAHDKLGNMYLFDSNSLFYVNENVIEFVHSFPTGQTSCQTAFTLDNLRLVRPTQTLVDPQSQDLIILDEDHSIYQVNLVFKTVKSILSMKCDADAREKIKFVDLDPYHNGLVVVTEENGRWSVIRVGLTDGEKSVVVDDLSGCKCVKARCDCNQEKDRRLVVTSASVNARGHVYYTTSRDLLKAGPSAPPFDPLLNTFTISAPGLGQFYTFGADGQLITIWNSTTLQRFAEVRRETHRSPPRLHVVLQNGGSLSTVRAGEHEWSVLNGGGDKFGVLERAASTTLTGPDGSTTAIQLDPHSRLSALSADGVQLV